MTIKPKDTCLVLDLDDTLYKEYDYVASGLEYLEIQILKLYGVDLTNQLQRFKKNNVDDIFLEITKILNLPPSTKQSFHMMYRYHTPNISLTAETKNFLKDALDKFNQVVILTDGRSVTQRLKMQSLNLLNIPTFISEEWSSIKPEKKRFNSIMDEFSFCKRFCYVADNPIKDFIAPNKLGWLSICLRGDKQNIHSQKISSVLIENHPQFWVESLNGIYKC